MLTTFLFVFILGTIIGSFLNVVILRYNTGRGIGGRSGCLSCGKKLEAIELIPIFSWIYQRGKCKKCGAKISIQYPLVEFFTGLLFVFLFYRTLPFLFDPKLVLLSFVWNSLIFAILIIIFVYDLRHKIIPDLFSYSFAILAFLQTVVMNPINSQYNTLNYLNLFSGIIMFLPFFLLWFVSGGKWIGLGDGKLALGIGWYLGFIGGISAIVMAFWIGAIFALLLMLIDRLKLTSKNITMKTEVPFGPFLIIGIIIEFFARIDVIGISLFF
ncbi:MAG TPA: prepilin peptidase [Candidatus Paceibacterota bacterium]|nr:prepilin peptidase [Candidatus Paceibacterota bacterium]HMP19162.1 prepilin peptidase [Candidatus Paceibacterota bacterium]HMP85213.1 prepilin peptidase [Candidatus Paceibacterota bacterium]